VRVDVDAALVFVLIEKAAPGGEWFARIGGAALAGAGAWMMISG
jgi:predicted metal-binding membrane protein